MKKIPKENIKDVLRKTYSDVEYLKVTYNNDYIIVKWFHSYGTTSKFKIIPYSDKPINYNCNSVYFEDVFEFENEKFEVLLIEPGFYWKL